MKSIKQFLHESEILNTIDLTSETEIRFVLHKNEKFPFPVDKSKALDWTDFYISRTNRIRVMKDKQGDEQFFIIQSEPGSPIKQKNEVERDTYETILKTNHILLTIDKKGIGVVNINGIEGYMEQVVAKSKTHFLFDEVMIEFENLKDKKIFAQLEKLLNPEKIFQLGLYEYANRF